MINFTLPLRIEGANLDKRSPLGARMLARRFALNHRAKKQRQAAHLAVLAHAGPAKRRKLTAGPFLVVTLTRHSAGELDEDNLRAGFKHVRDGIADAFALNDRDPLLWWIYAQQHCAPKTFAVSVRLEMLEQKELVERLAAEVGRR